MRLEKTDFAAPKARKTGEVFMIPLEYFPFAK
jgi:hypothetical protein